MGPWSTPNILTPPDLRKSLQTRDEVIGYRLGTLVDGKAGEEPSKYSTTSTRAENIPLIKHIEDEAALTTINVITRALIIHFPRSNVYV